MRCKMATAALASAVVFAGSSKYLSANTTSVESECEVHRPVHANVGYQYGANCSHVQSGQCGNGTNNCPRYGLSDCPGRPKCNYRFWCGRCWCGNLPVSCNQGFWDDRLGGLCCLPCCRCLTACVPCNGNAAKTPRGIYRYGYSIAAYPVPPNVLMQYFDENGNGRLPDYVPLDLGSYPPTDPSCSPPGAEENLELWASPPSTFVGLSEIDLHDREAAGGK